MVAYIIRRLFLMIFVLFGVVTLVFFLLHFIPGDPVDIMLGDFAIASDKNALRQSLGLDKPVFEQYKHYLGGVITGDLGESIHSKRPVISEIAQRIPASAELMAGAMIVALVMAFPLGIVSAIKPHSLIDSSAMVISFFGVSIPNFWLGPLLIIFFSVNLGWFPINGRGTLGHLVLPSITLGTAMAAMLSRMIRSSLLEVLGEEYIRHAKARGLNQTRVILLHGLPNALIPVITIIGLQVGVLLSGAIITEAVFDWPGMGSLLLSAIHSRNYPLVQGCILTIASIYVVVNLLTDLAYAWVDPRVRLS